MIILPLKREVDMESYAHKDLKFDCYWKMVQDDIGADLEKTLGKTRTDILSEVNGKLLAIEIQFSPISINSILARMQEHSKYNAHTLWVIGKNLLDARGYARNYKWVRFLQMLQNGVIFIPGENQQIIPARIDNSLAIINNEVVASNKKIIDCHNPIDIDEIKYDFNDVYKVNITTFDEWWLSGFLDLI